MKKILIDAKCIGGEGQGMVTYLIEMYNAMYASYSDQYEFFFAGYHEQAISNAFPFMKTNQFILLPKTNKINLLWNVFPKIIEDYNIDLAHFQYVTPFRKKCKYIVTTHDVLFLDFPEEFSFSYIYKRKFLFKRSLINSDIRLTVSNYSRNRISDLFKVPADSIHITPNAVHEKFFDRFNKQEVQKQLQIKFGFENYLLYVSRIEKRKNHRLILETYENSNLAEQGIQLVLVGNDTLGETDVIEKLNKLKTKYPGMVHWIPFVEEADLLDIYRGARVFLYPSLAEGFGIPPIEAAALGLETLCSNLTAMEDFTFFGNQLFDPNDKEEFENKLIQLLKRTEPSHLNTKNRDFIQQHYAWNNAAKVLHQEIIKQTTPKIVKRPALV